jgi:hypothetical protein
MAKAPPVVNPLPPEVIDRLRVSEISFRSQPASDYRASLETVDQAKALIKHQIIKALGARYSPGKGDTLLTISFLDFRIFGGNGGETFVTLWLSGQIDLPEWSASYISANLTVGQPANVPPSDPRAALPLAAETTAGTLVNNIFQK